ncbi:Tetratricopeptide repeat-containing protein [Flavobacterium sp. 9AF]|uniref:tetratricopeptide repeat protein n=1 Tax=Flavobacterium sp. 9AF TaxID=2653142 RepID=UPI0012F2AAE5|nr:tetratricopeptide repeat protein [Flavobacterium sp. 9AF]VXB21624.1 Tetratricopeptide repeat-containing protein [Flavobacterium sp. 9AF]
MNISIPKAVLFSLFFYITSFAQNMQEGFSYLENGDFEKAEVFFENTLKEFPTNKTARLCYARAIGLNKQPENALSLFVQLLKEYPEDLEIQLNYAEALLWNKKFEEAKSFYEKLITNNPENFVAHLGYANTLSNLKIYDSALYHVNKALTISNQNSGALLSRKYIKLGLANEKISSKNYEEAERLYDEILIDFPNDKETLLNKANLFLISKQIKKGEAVYQLLAQENPNLSLNGLSLLAHLENKDKKALAIATTSLKQSDTISEKTIVKQTQERYVQALIWNRKYKEASQEIDTLSQKYPNENWVMALSATLAIYQSNFNQSIQDYETILKNDDHSFDGNLGIANAYYASRKVHKAYEAVYKTLEIFPNQNDAMQFLKKLNAEHTPFVEEKMSYSFDNGNNIAFASLTQLTIPTSLKWSFYSSYQYRKTENSVTKVFATTNDFMIGTTYKFHPKASFTLHSGISNASSFTNSYSQLLLHSFFKVKPMPLQDLEVGYKREMQNFNSDLIDKEIISNHFYTNYNISTNFKLGWFTQYFYTTQSDSNTRNLLFTSLYYNFLVKPVLKGGINYQYISFKNQVPTDYFSPKKFHAYEVFIDFLKDENSTEVKRFFYNLNGATGFQFIEENDKQWTYRVQGKLGYKFSDRLIANVYGLRSNIASTTAAGFTYNELGIRLKWYICKEPIFKTKKTEE